MHQGKQALFKCKKHVQRSSVHGILHFPIENNVFGLPNVAEVANVTLAYSSPLNKDNVKGLKVRSITVGGERHGKNLLFKLTFNLQNNTNGLFLYQVPRHFDHLQLRIFWPDCRQRQCTQRFYWSVNLLMRYNNKLITFLKPPAVMSTTPKKGMLFSATLFHFLLNTGNKQVALSAVKIII